MSSNQLAVLSPRDGVAGLLDVDSETVMLMTTSAATHKMPLRNYLERFPDTLVTAAPSVEAIGVQLAVHQQNVLALDLLISILDSRWTPDTRKEIAGALDKLLNDERRNYVFNVLLAHPLPDDAKAAEAAHAARSFPNVAAVIETIVEAQARVGYAHKAWASLSQNFDVRQFGAEKLLGCFVRSGVFRQLTMHGKTEADVEQLLNSVSLENVRERQRAQVALESLCKKYLDLLSSSPISPARIQTNDRRRHQRKIISAWLAGAALVSVVAACIVWRMWEPVRSASGSEITLLSDSWPLDQEKLPGHRAGANDRLFPDDVVACRYRHPSALRYQWLVHIDGPAAIVGFHDNKRRDDQFEFLYTRRGASWPKMEAYKKDVVRYEFFIVITSDRLTKSFPLMSQGETLPLSLLKSETLDELQRTRDQGKQLEILEKVLTREFGGPQYASICFARYTSQKAPR